MTKGGDVGDISPLLKQSSDVVAVRGEGVHLYGNDGRRYLDFTAGIGVTSTGHCHPKVVEAVRRQAGEIIHAQYTTVRHPGLIELSERLGSLMPEGIDTFFYASAGSEAVEAALRLARHATGRPNIVVFDGSFHGRTMGAASLTTSKGAVRSGIQPMMGGVHVAPFPYAFRYGWDEEAASRFSLYELDRLLDTTSPAEDTAAMFIEPVLGEGGYVPAPTSFMRGLRERCDSHGILLVADEIQTGIGRTGRFWGHEHHGIVPDVVITAKGLASGFPLSAFGAPRELMAKGRPGSQGGTYGGNAVACAAALATLDVVAEEGLVERAAELGVHLAERLRAVGEEHDVIGDVRSIGLMGACEFMHIGGMPNGGMAGRVLKEAEAEGLLLLTCGPSSQVVRFIPALVVERHEIDEAVDIFTEAVKRAA